MGIFDALTGRNEIRLSAQGALLLAAISMIAADGDVDDDELAIVRRLDGAQRTNDWDDALRAWRANSVSDCVAQVAGILTPEQQLTTLANLIDIAMADGVLAGNERTLLEAYVGAFDVPQERIDVLVEAIAMKNDRSAFRSA